MNDYQDQIDEVKRQEEKLRAQLAELESKKQLLSNFKPITVSNFILHAESGTFTFKCSDYRYDMVEAIRPYRTWNAADKSNTAQCGQLDTILSKLGELANVEINLPREIADSIRIWTPEPDIDITLDGYGDFNYKYGFKYMLRTLPQNIRGSVHKPAKSQWVIPKSRALELYNIIKDNSNFVTRWSPEALNVCEEIIERIKIINDIATRDHSILPEEMKKLGEHKLMEFQAQTLEIALATHGRMLIQHEMGLGKTPCALAYAEYLRTLYAKNGKKFSCVIITPALAKPNWMAQVMKFTGQVPYKLSGSTPYKHDQIALMKKEMPYFLINYDPISDSFVDEIKKSVNKDGITVEERIHGSLWVELFNLVQPDLYIIDEAHYLKNSSSKRTQAVMALDTSSSGILLLTGTSITNRPNDLHALIYLIDKDVAGSRESFINRYFDRYTGVKNSAELREILKPIAFRKTKKEVLKELAPIRRITKEYELTPAGQRRYNLVLAGVYESMKDWDGSGGNTQQITSILTELLRCKQVIAEDKIPYTVDLAKEIIENSDENDKYNKVIIFSQFVNEPAVCKEIHHELGESSLLITGAQNPEQRFKIIEQFQSDDTKKYLVCSIMAASEALNITAAGHVIFHDLVWTPATHHQAEGRAYGRLNDPHTVDAYYVVTPGTIEDHIWALLERKLAIFTEVIEGAEAERDSSVAMSVIQLLREMRRMM